MPWMKAESATVDARSYSRNSRLTWCEHMTGQSRIEFRRNGCHLLFVDGIAISVQQADRQTFHGPLAQEIAHRPSQLIHVEWADHVARRIDPLGHLERVRTADDVLGLAKADVVDLRAVLPLQQQEIAGSPG